MRAVAADSVLSRIAEWASPDMGLAGAGALVPAKEVTKMRLTVRGIFEDVAGAVVVAATLLGYTATHEQWNVWLIGDSRRWTAGLLSVLGIAVFALALRHVSGSVLGSFLVLGVTFAGLAFWTAALTPLSFLAGTIVVVWGIAVLRDLIVLPHTPVPH